jgi:DnaJ-class molecular chaperone
MIKDNKYDKCDACNGTGKTRFADFMPEKKCHYCYGTGVSQRRIVACVNACIRIATDRLEHIAELRARGEGDAATEALAILSEQRTKLLTELKIISDQEDLEMILDPTWAKRIAIEAIKDYL